jgi:pSer/pThr/pTyr-binding forkhead associated (FHA) protein/outer membrane protein assembly factor BamB
MAQLLLKNREKILGEYILRHKLKISIGSGKGNDIVITDDENISEIHFTITLTGKKYIVKDQNTINGTSINNKLIHEKSLENGDVITVGYHTIVYYDSSFFDREERHYLLGIYGLSFGEKYNIKDSDTYIGREKVSTNGVKNDIVLFKDKTVSKGHARISFADGQYSLTDVGSLGGVALNGVKVGQLNSVNLNIGDEISIGKNIFRFTTSKKEDYGPPEKQKILLLKLTKKFSIAVSFTVFFVSLFVASSSCSNIFVLTKYKKKLDLQLNDNFKINTPLREISESGISSTPAIGDVKGNGKNAVIMLTAAGFLYGWDAKSGANLWRQIEVPNSGETSPMLVDVNNDGIKDIVVLSSAAMLLIYDGATGAVIRQEFLGGAIAKTTPLVADLTENGKMDIVVCSEDGAVNFITNAGFESRSKKWTEVVKGNIYASPVLYKSKKSAPLIVVASGDGKVYLINPKTKDKKVIDVTEQTGKVHTIAGPPAVGDITGDGIPEIVVQTSNQQYITAIDAVNLKVLWSFTIELDFKVELKHNGVPLIADLSGKGNGDVFAVSSDGIIFALAGKTGYNTGEVLWKLDLPDTKNIIAYPSKYDFDKDGRDDFVIGTESGKILIVKSNIKRKEFEIIAEVKASNSPISSVTPLIADVFGTGKLNIMFSNSNDSLQLIDTNSTIIKNFGIWTMFLGNPSHTGFDGLSKYKAKYWRMFLISLIVFVGFFAFKIKYAVKKNSNIVKVKFL